jgi:hypothetical protein
VLLNIVTDMAPYFSILELKFIDIFKVNAVNLLSKRRRAMTMNALDSDATLNVNLIDTQGLLGGGGDLLKGSKDNTPTLMLEEDNGLPHVSLQDQTFDH